MNAQELIKKEQLSSDDLITLLKARESGEVEFTLIDVREPFEYEMSHIVPTDMLLPTTQFQQWFPQIQDLKEKNLIIYCRTGNRSYQVQQHLLQKGFKSVGNLELGIVAYGGETAQGAFEQE